MAEIPHTTLLHYVKFSRTKLDNLPIVIVEIPVNEASSYYYHDHDFTEITIITSGSATHILDNKYAHITKGDVLVIHPGAVHSYGELKNFGVLNILFDSSMLPIPTLDGTELPLFKHCLPQHSIFDKSQSPVPIVHLDTEKDLKKIREMANDLATELKSRLPGNTLASVVKLTDLVITILRIGKLTDETYYASRSYNLAFQHLFKYINDNLTKPLSINEMAKKIHLSTRQFQLKFKKNTGYSFSEYIAEHRISRACSMLIETDESIQNIAIACGYVDSNYFSRIFKKTRKESPSQYRKRLTSAHH